MMGDDLYVEGRRYKDKNRFRDSWGVKAGKYNRALNTIQIYIYRRAEGGGKARKKGNKGYKLLNVTIISLKTHCFCLTWGFFCGLAG